jgi:MFS family permease
MYTIVSALVPPVLSDQFGFNVEYTSHYLLVMSSAYLISSFLQLAAKCARTDNRKILGLGIVFAMAGSVLFGDWQAVHSDPCLTSNSTADYFPTSTLYASGENPTDTLCLGDSVTNSSYLQELVQSCESHGSSSNECFWNRQSRVTRTYCYTCLGVCLSLQRSQNIYQLSVAIMLLSISAGFLFVFSSAIVSDVASVKSQGKVASSVVGSGSLARCITPLWFIKSYEMTRRHTYFAMAIIAGYALVLLISLAALFKNLSPRNRGSALSATSKFNSDPVNQDPTGIAW